MVVVVVWVCGCCGCVCEFGVLVGLGLCVVIWVLCGGGGFVVDFGEGVFVACLDLCLGG